MLARGSVAGSYCLNTAREQRQHVSCLVVERGEIAYGLCACSDTLTMFINGWKGILRSPCHGTQVFIPAYVVVYHDLVHDGVGLPMQRQCAFATVDDAKETCIIELGFGFRVSPKDTANLHEALIDFSAMCRPHYWAGRLIWPCCSERRLAVVNAHKRQIVALTDTRGSTP